MKVRVLVLLKPDCLEKGVGRDVKSMLIAAGWVIIVEKKIKQATKEQLDAHYNGVGKLKARLTEAKGAEFAEKVLSSTFDYMMRGPIEALVIEKEVKDIREAEKAVSELRTYVIGATRPWEALPDTIRALFGNLDPNHEPIENVVHCSGTPREGEDEIKVWFPELA